MSRTLPEYSSFTVGQFGRWLYVCQVAYPITGRRCIVHRVDRSSHVTLGGLLTGAMVGFGLGWLFAVFRRAWRGLSRAPKATPGLGRAARRPTRAVGPPGLLPLVAGARAPGRGMGRRRPP